MKQITLDELLQTKRTFVKVGEITELLNMTERGIQNLCRKGQLGYTKPGKFYMIAVESLLEYLKIRR